MALIGNRSVLLKSPGRYFGGSTVSDNRSNFGTPGSVRGRFAGGFSQLSATPRGYRPPYSWIIAIKPGELASANAISGAGTFAGPGTMGVNGQGALTGSGDITAAVGQLIVSALASLTGSGGITDADLRGYLNAVAALAGAGQIGGALAALGWIAGDTSGSGTASSTARATGTLAAEIKSYGDLTPEGVRDAVWQKIIEAGFSAEQILRIVAAHAAGAATGLEGSNPQFTGLDGSTVRIDGTYAAGTRTIDALNGG